MGGNWQDVILNIIFVSIPEEICLVTIILIFLKQFDFMKTESRKPAAFHFRIRKNEIFKLSVPVISMAVVSNVLKHLGYSPGFVLLISMIIILLSVIIIYKLYSLNNLMKAFIFTILGLTIVMISESLYAPFIIYSTNKTVEEINNSFMSNFILSLPARIIQITVILFVFLKKATFLKASIVKPILQNKTLLTISIITVIFNITLLAVLGKLFIFDKILIGMNSSIQLCLIIPSIIFPFINIVALIIAVYFSVNSQNHRQYKVNHQLSRSVENIKMFANMGKYDEVKRMLNTLDSNIKNIDKNNNKDVVL